MQKTNQLIISFNGQEGSGKSTVSLMLAKHLNLPHYYMGQIFRDMAKEKSLTLLEFRKVCDADPSFDKKVDDYLVQLSQEQSQFVVESRTAWYFIPQSLKIYLQVDSRVAAERIFKGLVEKNNRGNEDTNLTTVENIQNSILQRRKEDSERYFSLYGIHQDDAKNYDLVLDTTHLTIDDVFEKILTFIHEKSS
jgi:cytidylate kinase